MRYHFTFTRLTKLQRLTVLSVAEDVEKLGIFIHDQWKCKMNCIVTLESHLAFSYKLNMDLLYNLATSLSGIYPAKMKTYSYEDLYSNDYSNFVHNNQKLETSQIPTKQSMAKQNVVYPQNEILLSNKKELLIHATLWVHIKSIMSHERSQIQKSICYMILLI